MSKNSNSLQGLPPEALEALVQLGQRLRAYRQQQEWTIEEMAERLFCSPTTCRALESGKPGTSIGILAHALWLLGQLDSVNQVAALSADFAASMTAGRKVRRRAAASRPGAISESDRDF
ncbi:MAG: helix-turn-helix transcriptional regulator [Pseudomonadota bacterium]